MLVALLGITTNGVHYDGCQGRRDVRVEVQDRGRVLRNMLVNNGKHVFAFKGSMPAEHFVEHDANCVDVRASCATFALQLFGGHVDRKSTRLNSSHQIISYAVFCLKKKKTI